MNNDDLVLRQQQLLVRSAQLRIALADQAQVLRKPFALADQARNSLQWLYRNPQWPVGVLLLLFLVRPRRVVLWGGRAWWAWTTLNRARGLLASLPLTRRSS